MKFDYGTEIVICKDGFLYEIEKDNIETGFVGPYVTKWANGNEMFNSHNSIRYSKEYISHKVIASNNPKLTKLPALNTKTDKL